MRVARISGTVCVATAVMAAWACQTGTEPGGGKLSALQVAWHVETAANMVSFFLGTPAVDGGLVFVEDGNTVLALDAATGAKRWVRSVRIAPIPAARALLTHNGVVYVSEVDSVLAMRESDGVTIWNFHPDSQAVVYPALDDRALYTGQRGVPIVYALGLTDGRLLWKTNISKAWPYRGFITGTAASGDTVYVAARKFLAENGYIAQGVLVALDRTDGHELWRYETPGQQGGLEDAPVVAGRYLVVSDLIGNSAFAYDRFALKEVWRLPRSTNGSLTPPVVINDDVFLGSADTYLYDIDLTSGSVKWKQTPGGSIGGTTYCAGQVFIQADMIQRRDPQRGGAYTGYVNYVPGKGPFTSNLASDGTRVYVTGEDGVYAINCQ